MKTFEEVRALLADAFSKERKRLKSYGTKASSFDLANAVARHVLALMAGARYNELKRFSLHGLKTKKEGWTPVIDYLNERMKATKSMSKAIKNMAESNDSKRPWNYGGNNAERRKSKKKNRKKKRN